MFEEDGVVLVICFDIFFVADIILIDIGVVGVAE